jgi:hypothetical protein
MTTMLIIENYTSLGRDLSGDSSRIKQFTAAAKGLKMLRPLRLARTPALRDTLGSLISSLPNLIAAWLINVLFLYVFGILGVQLMCGKVSSCADATFLTKAECLAAGKEWVLPPEHYNDIFSSMRTFFEIQTLQDWHYAAWIGMNSSNEQDVAGIKNNNWGYVTMYIAFVFLTSYFVVNTFIVILIASFHELFSRKYGLDNVNDESMTWIKILTRLSEV